MKKLAVLAVFLFLASVASIWFYQYKNKVDFLDPLSSKENKIVKVGNKYKVVGFLPTWNIGKTIDYCGEVNELVFLGIEVKETGDLALDAQYKKLNSDKYLSQKESFKKCGGKNILGIKLFDDKKIDKLMSDESAKSNLIEQVVELSRQNNFDGVNFDFEYQGNPTAILEDEFFNFMSEFKKSYSGEVGVDVFANTIIKGGDVELKRMVDGVDELIVMAYDFHRPGMDSAGAVAPVNSTPGDRNILEIIQKIVAINIDKKKIVMAYPLYGYEWKTETADFEAKVIRGYSALATYKRMKELTSDPLDLDNFKKNWDETSMSPWVSYTENGVIKEIYYEDLESLSRKVKLVTDGQLGGVGFWALGYEGENGDLWNEVSKVLN